MKKNRRLLKLVELTVEESFTQGKLIEDKVSTFIGQFKKQSLPQAIFALTEYLKGLKRKLSETTLVIESSTDLSKEEIDQIKKEVQKGTLISGVKYIKNPSLLGGIKVKIADWVLDDSVKSRINMLGGAIRG